MLRVIFNFLHTKLHLFHLVVCTRTFASTFKLAITTMRKLWYLWEQLDGACGPDSKPDDDEDEKEDAANWILWEEVVVVRGWCTLIEQQIASKELRCVAVTVGAN